jgi:hypothetical protein
MHDLLQPLLPLVIISLGVMFQFPFEQMLKVVGKLGSLNLSGFVAA